MPNPYLSVVIPAYNEENRLPKTLERLFAYLPTLSVSYEIIVADDGSKDGTARLVQELSKTHPELKLFSDGVNRGRAPTIKRGVLAAQGELILETDADGSVAEEAIGRCVDEFKKHPELDVVFGSREAKGAKTLVWQPPLRVFLGYGFLYLTRVVFWMWNITDFALGFKMFRRAAAADIFAHQYEPYVCAEAEIIYVTHVRGHSYTEIPVIWTDDADSRIRVFREVLRSLLGLLRTRVRSLQGKYR